MRLRSLFAASVLLMSFSTASADFAACSKSMSTNKNISRALDFLRGVPSRFELGGCQIEIHICAAYADDESPGSLAGDILVQDQAGNRHYMQFDFSEDSKKINRETLNGSRMFHYESDDYNGNPVDGAQESYRFEILKSPDLSRVTRIELGTYTSNNHARSFWPWKPRYIWAGCGEDR